MLKSSPEAGNPSGSSIWKPHVVKRLGQHVVQLEVSPARNLLLALTDEGVGLFSLPQLLMKGLAERTKGATCFSWDDTSSCLAVGKGRRYALILSLCSPPTLGKATPPSSLSHTHNDTIQNIYHRVLMYNYDGLEFVRGREITIPEEPTSVCLTCKGIVYVATKKYVYRQCASEMDISSHSLTHL